VNPPFTPEEFLEAFAGYNRSLWPFALGLWLYALSGAFVLTRSRHGCSRFIALQLAVQWAWASLAYHALFFATINPAAWLFAALFLVQSLLFTWFGGGSAAIALLTYRLATPCRRVGAHRVLANLPAHRDIGRARLSSNAYIRCPMPDDAADHRVLVCLGSAAAASDRVYSAPVVDRRGFRLHSARRTRGLDVVGGGSRADGIPAYTDSQQAGGAPGFKWRWYSASPKCAFDSAITPSAPEAQTVAPGRVR
jgi:uncharacterized protein DUF6064